jgi:hypothetical protein
MMVNVVENKITKKKIKIWSGLVLVNMLNMRLGCSNSIERKLNKTIKLSY